MPGVCVCVCVCVCVLGSINCTSGKFFFLHSHFAITHRPWVWKMVGSVHDLVHGTSMFTWHHQVYTGAFTLGTRSYLGRRGGRGEEGKREEERGDREYYFCVHLLP